MCGFLSSVIKPGLRNPNSPLESFACSAPSCVLWWLERRKWYIKRVINNESSSGLNLLISNDVNVSARISGTGRAALPIQSADSLENVGGIVETMSRILEGHNNFQLYLPVPGKKQLSYFLRNFLGEK